MDHDELAHWSKRAADWARDYHAGLRDRPVRPDLAPGDFRKLIDAPVPEQPEAIETIFDDFARLVPDAMTHWQHPRFFAYFPANAAPVSMLAEQLANAMASQAMLWQTAPAANEMEALVVDWMRDALGLPADFTGTIHDSATTATFSAVTTMREKALGFQGIGEGLSGAPSLRIYASAQTHSSVDKAVRLSGIGQNNLVKVAGKPDDPRYSMDPAASTRRSARIWTRASGRRVSCWQQAGPQSGPATTSRPVSTWRAPMTCRHTWTRHGLDRP